MLFLIFANFIAGLFLKSGDASEFETAAFFIRCMVIQYLMMSVSFSLSGVYQGVRNMVMNYLTVIFRETVLPVVAVIVLGLLFGIKGVGTGFIAAGVLCLLVSFLMPAIARRKMPKKAADFILLPEDFGPRAEDTFEASISDMDGVIEASAKVSEFYKERGIDQRTTLFVSLFLEEMLRNTIEHGYLKALWFKQNRGTFLL